MFRPSNLLPKLHGVATCGTSRHQMKLYKLALKFELLQSSCKPTQVHECQHTSRSMQVSTGLYKSTQVHTCQSKPCQSKHIEASPSMSTYAHTGPCTDAGPYMYKSTYVLVHASQCTISANLCACKSASYSKPIYLSGQFCES